MGTPTPVASTPGLDDEPGFRQLAHTAPDAIVTGDAQNRIAYVNPAAERLFGHAAEELVGRPITALMPERLRAAHASGYRRFVETGRGHLVGTTIEVTAARADGSEFPIELSLGSAGTGSRRTLTAVIRDLTDRRRRERHLAAQLAVTAVLAGARSAAETPPRIVEELTRALGWDVGALWLIDADGRLRVRHVWQAQPGATVDFARACAELTLAPGQGLPGAALQARRPVWLDDLAASTVFLRRQAALAAGLRGAICLPLLTGDRASGVIECFTREAMPVDDGLRDLLMTVASQVGEHLQRLEAQERLDEARARVAAEIERSNSELEHFAHIAAHDLRTPLATIAGFTDLLLRRHGQALPDEGQTFLRMIRESAEGSGRLLDNLLSYARAGGDPAAREPVDPRPVLEEVLTTLRSQIEARDADVTVGELPWVAADRVQLAQVFQNLIANAIKFTPTDQRPRVAISGRADGPLVRLCVADDGIGVSPEEVPRLFAMFARGTNGDAFAGTGIGLAVCARIVDRHGGRLWVEPAPGGGSVFCFTLPGALPG